MPSLRVAVPWLLHAKPWPLHALPSHCPSGLSGSSPRRRRSPRCYAAAPRFSANLRLGGSLRLSALPRRLIAVPSQLQDKQRYAFATLRQAVPSHFLVLPQPRGSWWCLASADRCFAIAKLSPAIALPINSLPLRRQSTHRPYRAVPLRCLAKLPVLLPGNSFRRLAVTVRIYSALGRRVARQFRCRAKLLSSAPLRSMATPLQC